MPQLSLRTMHTSLTSAHLQVLYWSLGGGGLRAGVWGAHLHWLFGEGGIVRIKTKDTLALFGEKKKKKRQQGAHNSAHTSILGWRRAMALQVVNFVSADLTHGVGLGGALYPVSSAFSHFSSPPCQGASHLILPSR